MNRKFLEGLGLDKETADAVMSENGKDIETAKAPVKELEENNKRLQETVKERDSQLEGLKAASGDVEGLKNQIEQLQTANTTKTAEYESALQAMRMEHALERELGASGAKNLKAVRALLDLEDVKVKEDGTVKGLAEQLEALKKGEKTGFLFESAKTEEASVKLKGVTVRSGTGELPTPGGFEARLAEARKKGDNLEAIQIKQEAAAEGVILV